MDIFSPSTLNVDGERFTIKNSNMLITGEIYHLLNRGVEERVIFKNKRDYERFLVTVFESNDINSSFGHRGERWENNDIILIQKQIKPLVEILSFFPALRNRNYQLYFSGQLISLIGTWLQMVAQAWLVLKLTNSAFLMGLVVAVGTAPTLLFSLFGGVIVDRFPKREILIFTQVSSMILAFILGFLTIFNLINVWEIAILAFFVLSWLTSFAAANDNQSINNLHYNFKSLLGVIYAFKLFHKVGKV